MAWHWSHIALILPLAGAVYRHGLDLDAVVADRALLRDTMQATAQGFAAIRRAGYPILPRSLNVMRWVPAALGAGRIAALLRSEFGRVALVGHAATARDEMRGFDSVFLALAGENAGPELRAVLGPSTALWHRRRWPLPIAMMSRARALPAHRHWPRPPAVRPYVEEND